MIIENHGKLRDVEVELANSGLIFDHETGERNKHGQMIADLIDSLYVALGKLEDQK